MIRVDVAQGSPEWLMARLAKVTASQMDRIITASGKPSAQADKYMHQLIAEELLGVPMDNASSGFMERGSILEQRAVAFYEMQKDVNTEPAGFVLRDDERVGASPDRLVGDDGLLEIKIPSAGVHISYLLDEEGIGYKAQVQAQLWIAERDYCDTLSWHPELPTALVRQGRDEKYIATMKQLVDQFLAAVDESKVKLQKRYDLFEGFLVPDLKVVA